MSMTVTVTRTGSGTAPISLCVKALTGAAALAAQPGAVTISSPYGNANTITPEASGSYVYGISVNGFENYPDAAYSAATTLLMDAAGSAGEQEPLRSAGTTTANQVLTLGVENGVGSSEQVLLAEILANGTLAEDSSSPAPVPGTGSSTLTSVTSRATAAFEPPPGALLVAMAGIFGSGNGLAVSDSSGLAWKELNSYTYYSSTSYIWAAQVPPVADSDAGAGAELTVPLVLYHADTAAGGEDDDLPVLGWCRFCGQPLVYANPNPAAANGNAAVTDMQTFYSQPGKWYDYSLLDYGSLYGKFCPFAPAHPLGQASLHEIVYNPNQP